MQISPNSVWSDLQTIKKTFPLVHNITNYVVMEHTANSLLAIGASPVMAHALEEVQDMAKIANSLVLNIGTLSPSWIKAMMLALKAASAKGIPIVFDPVGVGATFYRTDAALAILSHSPITAVRGNASEILALGDKHFLSKGVDSLLRASDYQQQAKVLASKRKCIVWMSGQTDVITDGHTSTLVDNGDALMTKVTGMGCAATAIAGAFLAVNPNHLLGSSHAAILMGVAGELAAAKCKGPGTFKQAFLDALYTVTLEDLEKRMRVKISTVG